MKSSPKGKHQEVYRNEFEYNPTDLVPAKEGDAVVSEED